MDGETSGQLRKVLNQNEFVIRTTRHLDQDIQEIIVEFFYEL